MIEIRQEDYLHIADVLKAKLEGQEFFNGYIEVEVGGYDAILTATLIVYHKAVEFPEGTQAVISDVVPVWCEFEVYDADRYELFNDFSFNGLRPLLAEQEITGLPINH